MKKIIYILVLTILFACDSESASDCFQTSGGIIQQEFTVPNFETIFVNRDIELIIKQGATQQVIVETGANLLNDVTVEVIGNQLVLTDDNNCNFVRDFGITKVFVTTPNLTKVTCSTQYDISSDGVLNFDNLSLVSENFTADNFAIGDFRMQLDVENLNISANNLSLFFISGTAENASISFAGGNGRFEGRDLVIQDLAIFNRGTNDIIVNPQQSITGSIVSTGNVISVNQPPIVDVIEAFSGRLIFE